MRKLVAIFLLMLMPLQATWAVVNVYCTHHEEGIAAQHLGHHEDEHPSENTSAEDGIQHGSSTLSETPHADHCHGSTPAVVSFVSLTFPALTDIPSYIAESFSDPTAPTARIERPNWASLA